MLGDLGQTIYPLLTQILYWAVYIAFSLFMLILIGVAAYMTQFKYRLTYWEVVGGQTSSEKGGLTIDKQKKNRFKWNKSKTAWVPLYPLMTSKEIEPFEPEFIYPGKQLYAFRIGDAYVPAKIMLKKDGENTLGVISPIPYHIRNWQKLELKQNEAEFTKHTFWDDNKTVILGIVIIISCSVIAALTVYWTYRFASGGRADISALTKAIQGLSNVGGHNVNVVNAPN